MNRVAVVVLNWNGAPLLADCLNSLLAQDHPNFYVIVVDNHSSDTSREVLEGLKEEAGDRLQVIYNEKNSGFAGGVNIGIRHAIDSGAVYTALFNNDATARPNWLSGLTAVLNSNQAIGIATGLFLHTDGRTIDSTGDFYSVWGLAFPRNRDEATEKAPAPGYVFGATGGASLYRTDLFKRIGLFDEAFFAYYEDVDISFRAQLRGWRVYYTNVAVAYHKQGASSAKIPGFTKYQMFKNLPMLFWKNVPTGLLWKIGWRFVLIYFLMFINAVFRGSFAPAIKGVAVSLFYLPRSITQRRVIQQKKTVSDEYVHSLLWNDLPPAQKGIVRKIFGHKG